MALTLTLFNLVACAATPTRVGLVNGRLQPCPASPNCVCSQGKEDPKHAIEPLTFVGELAAAKQRLRAVINGMPRTKMAEERDDYWRVEFTSFFLRFVDDVEFLFDPQAKVIQVRSASRVGYSDLGVNRKRVEEIRKRFNAG